VKNEVKNQTFFKAAAKVAEQATCYKAKCGAVIVKSGAVIGKGYNSPPNNDEDNRMCEKEYDYSKKPKYDKTCCVHAEWRAITDALKNHSDKIKGSTLYFMRVDEGGNFTDAGEPFCTVCSRLALDSGIKYFVLWNASGEKNYDTKEYNKLSYDFHAPKNSLK